MALKTHETGQVKTLGGKNETHLPVANVGAVEENAHSKINGQMYSMLLSQKIILHY